MGILDRFTSKPNIPKGYVKATVTFTQEEAEAITASLDCYAAISNAEAPEGQTFYVHPKVNDAMMAKALTEYARELVGKRMDECCSAAEMKQILNMAAQAQIKAYAIHSLPTYLYL